MLHQMWSDHENWVFKIQLIAQNWVFKTWDVSKVYTFETVHINNIIGNMGLIPNFGPKFTKQK